MQSQEGYTCIHNPPVWNALGSSSQQVHIAVTSSSLLRMHGSVSDRMCVALGGMSSGLPYQIESAA